MRPKAQPNMKVLRPRSTASLLADRMREEIADGTLRPGQQLLQEELSARYGVSRSPLREALRQLEAEGIVEYHANRGAVVTSLDAADLREIFELRRILEVAAIRFAVSGMDDRTIEEAKSILARLTRSSDFNQWKKLHWEFHECLYRRARRPRLLALILDHRVKIDRFRHADKQVRRLVKDSAHDHRALLDACAARDVRAAVRLTLEHLDHVEARFLAALADESAANS